MYLLNNWISVKELLPEIFMIIDDDILSEEDVIELLYLGLEYLTTKKWLQPDLCMKIVQNYATDLPSYFKHLDFVMYRKTESPKESLNTINIYDTSSESLGTFSNGTYHLKKTVYSEFLSCSSCMQKWQFLNMSWSTMDLVKRRFTVCDMSPSIKCKCDDRFSIDYSAKKIVTTFSDGLLLIASRTHPKDENDEPIIPDMPEIRNALKTFVFMHYWQKKDALSESGAWNKFKDYQRQWEITSTTARMAQTAATVHDYQRIHDSNKLIKNRSPYESFYNASKQNIKLN